MKEEKRESRVEEHEEVRRELEELEEERGFRVLSARDFGSTAWNLDSEGSDRDVAFVFVQPALDYVKLGEKRETVGREIEFNGREHSFMGWDVRKFAELLNKSNPSVIEFLNSPLIYMRSSRLSDEGENLLEELEVHATDCFKPIALFYHYRSMAESNFQKYIKDGDETTKKRHLYVLRGLMYARYVEETHSFPVLDFTEFLDKAESLSEVPSDIIRKTRSLAEDKRNGKGGEQFEDEEVYNWIQEELDHKLDNQEHDVRGIEKEVINEVIEEVYSQGIEWPEEA